MLGWFTGLGIWIRLAIVAAILGAVALAIWYVYHSIWKDGYQAAEAVYVPQVQKLENDLKNVRHDLETALGANEKFRLANVELRDRVNKQNTDIAAFKAAALDAQESARQAMARVIRANAENQKARAELKRLQEILNGPPNMTEGDCEQADSILRTLLSDVMSNSGAAPARN